MKILFSLLFSFKKNKMGIFLTDILNSKMKIDLIPLLAINGKYIFSIDE